MKKINARQTPVYRDAGFYLENAATTKKAFDKEKEHPLEPEKYIYSRYRNPSVVATEKKLAKLEGSNWALLTQSGMSAIDMALSLFQKGNQTGTWLFFSDIYGGTNSFIDLVLIARRGIDIKRFEAKDGCYDLDQLERILDKHKPELLYFEVVSNPMLIVADAIKIIQMAQSYGTKVIVDNTFLTPFLWKPLDHGADLVIHSATKYLAGHGNLTAGLLCGNDENLMEDAIAYRKWIGHMLSPDDAVRLCSFLESFHIRMKQHCSNAFQLAKILNDHPKIEKVLYPGLEKSPAYTLARKLTNGKGYGGMVTFELAGMDEKDKAQKCDEFIEKIAPEIPLVPTLGDANTILLPVEAVWGDKYPYPGMIRLSVGIEEFVEIRTAFEKAL